MDEVFEQTLSVAPLTEAALFSDVGTSLLRFKVVREADWRGPDARGGPLHSQLRDEQDDAGTVPTATTAKAETPVSNSNSNSNANAGFFMAASEAAGGGRRGADFARALQRWLVGYVDSLPLDEIELMATA